ncbi:antibiotic biosynthesis monooxygenase [Nocardia colli]|uniref:Antibiotic biosynthesis monooxygenase n=1 Tax=Nocardia colli TaxID=2545717 RepID=A0A5N0E5P1_9NOCA|nr:putative quinol monooxygenase [Nocardia colli]KAA8884738.1 antibiotic biosynthesis monooxygenase [Nocardia colli]
MTNLVVVARVSATPADADELERRLRLLSDASKTEPGCLEYEVFRSSEHPERFVSIEKYTDADAFAAHRETEHFHSIGLAQVIPMLATRDIQVYPADSRLG